MLKKDRNRFIELISKYELDPADFKKHEKSIDEHPAFILQLNNSPLFFMVRTNKDDYAEFDMRYISFAPNFPKSEYMPQTGWTWIGDVYETFEYWLSNHVIPYREEIEAPDLWEQMQGSQLFIEDPLVSRDQSDFDKVEKENIRLAISQFEQSIKLLYQPTTEQIETIRDRLDYLSESLDRVNKVDWQGLAISTVISISIALSLDTTKGKELFSLFKESFSTIVKVISG